MRFESNKICLNCGCHKDWHEDKNGIIGRCTYSDGCIDCCHGNKTRAECPDYRSSDNLEYLEHCLEKK